MYLYTYIYTHMHTHCFFSLETLDYYRAKILVLYYFECFAFHVYLCFLFIWCFLESCDTLVYRCRDLTLYIVVPQYLLEIGSRDPHRYQNPQCFFQAPYRKWPSTENTVSPLIRGVHIWGYQRLTEQQDTLLAIVVTPRWTRLFALEELKTKCSDICDIRQIMINSGGET